MTSNIPTFEETLDEAAPVRLEAIRILSIHEMRLERHRKATNKQWSDAIKVASKKWEDLKQEDVPENLLECKERLEAEHRLEADLKKKQEQKKGELDVIDSQISNIQMTSKRILHSTHNPDDPQQGLDLEDDENPLGWLTMEDAEQVRDSMKDGISQGMPKNPVMERLSLQLRSFVKDRH